jgi:hypothetical protein
MDTFPAATVELLALTVAESGTPTTDYEVAIVPWGTASTDITGWAAPTTLDASTGVMIEGLTPGVWAVWTRVTSNPESPVMLNGPVEITR